MKFNQASSPSPTSLPSGTYYYPPAPSGGDDTTALNSFIASIPSGTAERPSIVLFDPSHTYRLSASESVIHVRNKAHVHIYGMNPALATGAISESTPRTTLRNEGPNTHLGGSAWGIGNSTGPNHDIKIIGFRIIGTNTANYRTLDQYTVGAETSCGFQMYAVGGQHHVEIAYNIVEHQWGHGLYLRTNTEVGQWDNVDIHHNVIRGMGVMGIAVANGTNISIDDNWIYDTALFPIDLEDEAAPSYIENLYIRRNLIDTFGWNRHYPGPGAIGSYSPLNHTNIYIQDNVIQGQYHSIVDPNWDHTRGIIDIRPGGFSVGDGPGVGSNIVITGNVSTVPHDGIQIRVHSTNGLTVTNNTFTGSSVGTGGNPTDHADVVLQSVSNSNVTQSGNTIDY